MLSIAAKEWMAEGAAKGKVAGKADTLLRQLRRKYREVPAAVVERVQTAGVDQLNDWSERILDAKTLQDVFQ